MPKLPAQFEYNAICMHHIMTSFWGFSIPKQTKEDLSEDLIFKMLIFNVNHSKILMNPHKVGWNEEDLIYQNMGAIMYILYTI